MATDLTSSELDAFRDDADRFIAELDEEYYLHFAGHKETLELEQIYEAHEELTKLETAQRLEGAPTELWRFACEGYLGGLTREHAEKLAEVEAELEATVDGEQIPYRMLRVAMSNEPDRDRRERLERARLELLDEHLNPRLPRRRADRPRGGREARRRRTTTSSTSGSASGSTSSPRSARRCSTRPSGCGSRPATGSSASGSASASPTRAPPTSPGSSARPSSTRATRPTGCCRRSRRRSPISGIDLRAQRNVHLDLEQRPGKSPRAFCSPIEIPGKVMLVIQPIGGHDDWRALFHEAGHTEHYANTSADLPMEAKRLGDMAVTEGWAALFEHLVDEPAWLNRRLDVPASRRSRTTGAVSTLYFVRRYSAKLLYEIEFFQADDPESMRPRYAELLTDALKLPANPESYLDDIDGSFYVTGYLRSWAFEAQLRDFLRSEFGNDWFARREAGDLLRELWSLGQGPTAEELLRDVTGARLEMASVAERVREGLDG